MYFQIVSVINMNLLVNDTEANLLVIMQIFEIIAVNKVIISHKEDSEHRLKR